MKNTLKYSLLTILLATGIANASEAIINLGVGVGNSKDSRFLSVGVQDTLWNAVKDRVVVGGWMDDGLNRSSSGFGMGQLGVEVDSGVLVGSVFSGVGAITDTDGLLGGHVQFRSDLGLGFHDRDGNYIGIGYSHISSAGMYNVNLGRDFPNLVLKFPL